MVPVVIRLSGLRALANLALVALVGMTSAGSLLASAGQACEVRDRTCDLPRVEDCCCPAAVPAAPVVTPDAEISLTAARVQWHAVAWLPDTADLATPAPASVTVASPAHDSPPLAAPSSRCLIALLI
jgi:hypothetical protein